MRRIFVLALAALALLGVVTPDAFAQAPTPTFKINGLIDQVTSYTSNISVYDWNLQRNDTAVVWPYPWPPRLHRRSGQGQGRGRHRDRPGLRPDGIGRPTTQRRARPSPWSCSGCTGSFDINTDVRTIIELKWLYTEFEMPLIPVPTVVRLGAQPFGGAANYKLAAYANGDFAGVNIVSTITPNVKLNFTYVAGRGTAHGLHGSRPATGTSSWWDFFAQLRGDDFAIIASPEITPIKGLDLKPMYSYFYASGTTNVASRSGRGGVNTTTAFTAPQWRLASRASTRTAIRSASMRGCAWGRSRLTRPSCISSATVTSSCRARLGASVCWRPTARTAWPAPPARRRASIAKADISAWLFDVSGGLSDRSAAPGSHVHVHLG